MNTKQLPVDLPDVQAAIYGLALSLDAFLMNGIQYGILQRGVFPGFLEKAERNLMRDLTGLEEQAAHAASQSKVSEAMTELRANCQRLVELVRGLTSFRTLTLEQLHSTISQIPLLREACVERLQELEACFRTPKPFYQSRPAHSTAAVSDFLADLERVIIQERSNAREGNQAGELA